MTLVGAPGGTADTTVMPPDVKVLNVVPTASVFDPFVALEVNVIPIGVALVAQPLAAVFNGKFSVKRRPATIGGKILFIAAPESIVIFAFVTVILEDNWVEPFVMVGGPVNFALS